MEGMNLGSYTRKMIWWKVPSPLVGEGIGKGAL